VRARPHLLQPVNVLCLLQGLHTREEALLQWPDPVPIHLAMALGIEVAVLRVVVILLVLLRLVLGRVLLLEGLRPDVLRPLVQDVVDAVLRHAKRGQTLVRARPHLLQPVNVLCLLQGLHTREEALLQWPDPVPIHLAMALGIEVAVLLIGVQLHLLLGAHATTVAIYEVRAHHARLDVTCGFAVAAFNEAFATTAHALVDSAREALRTSRTALHSQRPLGRKLCASAVACEGLALLGAHASAVAGLEVRAADARPDVVARLAGAELPKALAAATHALVDAAREGVAAPPAAAHRRGSLGHVLGASVGLVGHGCLHRLLIFLLFAHAGMVAIVEFRAHYARANAIFALAGAKLLEAPTAATHALLHAARVAL